MSSWNATATGNCSTCRYALEFPPLWLRMISDGCWPSRVRKAYIFDFCGRTRSVANGKGLLVLRVFPRRQVFGFSQRERSSSESVVSVLVDLFTGQTCILLVLLLLVL